MVSGFFRGKGTLMSGCSVNNPDDIRSSRQLRRKCVREAKKKGLLSKNVSVSSGEKFLRNIWENKNKKFQQK